MRVDGECRLDIGVSQDLLSDLRVDTRLREQGRASVAERVEGEPLRERPQPQRVSVVRAPPLSAVRGARDVAAASLAAAMLVALDDAGAAKRALTMAVKMLELHAISREAITKTPRDALDVLRIAGEYARRGQLALSRHNLAAAD